MNIKLNWIIAVMILSIVIISSCSKEDETKNTSEPTVVVFCDNTTYIDLDNIVFTIKNNTQDIVKYGACGFDYVLDYEIQIKTDTAWVTTITTPTCPDFFWAELVSNSQISDTISADLLDPGDYRFKIKLIVASNNTVAYSDEFNKK